MSAIRISFLVFIFSATAAAQTSAWQLMWNDEFDGPANTAPDQTKWTYNTGGGGWGNNELETYTNSTNNVFLDGNGHLVIQALASTSNGYTSYTSGRLLTQGLFTFSYGLLEARIKAPYASGIWPAFWTLGADINNVGWPQCGEIDVMENFGSNANDGSKNHGTVHGPGYSGGSGITATYPFPNGEVISGDYHAYSMIWSPNSVQLYVDGNLYSTVASSQSSCPTQSGQCSSPPSGDQWVFNNNPLFVLLNVAVGGNPAGGPSLDTVFPQQMLVDYVRVYSPITIDASTPAIGPGGIANAASYGTVLAPGSLGAAYGYNLSDAVYQGGDLFNTAANSYVTSTSSGVSLKVNGVNAPLTYVSPGQINFQVPWETPSTPNRTVNVTVSRGAITSGPEPMAFTASAPSAYAYATGQAILTCYGPQTAGTYCTIWGNGFGPKNSPQADGVLASGSSLSDIEVPGSPASCQLTIDGQTALVTYCGAAPGEIIDQLNFQYPTGVPVSSSPVAATLSVNGITGNFFVPSPTQ